MTKDFSNNLEGFIRLVLLLFSYNCFSQILPSTIGVHHKKESETQTNYALAFDGVNDYINTGTKNITSKWSAEVWYKKAGQTNAQNFILVRFVRRCENFGIPFFGSTPGNYGRGAVWEAPGGL